MKAEQIVHKMEKMVSLAKLAIKTEDTQEEAEATNLLEQLEAEIRTICAKLPDWVSVTEALPDSLRKLTKKNTWDICDVDRIALDAADLIEKLVAKQGVLSSEGQTDE